MANDTLDQAIQRSLGQPAAQGASGGGDVIDGAIGRALGKKPPPDTATGIGPGVERAPYDPRRITDWIEQGQDLTQEGAAANPIQAGVGKAAGFLVGGNQGIGTKKGGILTNPVIQMVASGPLGEAAGLPRAGSYVAGKGQGALQATVAAEKAASAWMEAHPAATVGLKALMYGGGGWALLKKLGFKAAE